jgi:uncharacterized protein (DUF362 family)
VSRNALAFPGPAFLATCLCWLALPSIHHGEKGGLIVSAMRDDLGKRARVVISHDDAATKHFQPQPDRIRGLVRHGLTNLTARPTVAAAWLSLVTTQDVVGIKVFTNPGPNVGTRPSVVAAVVEGLIEAGLPPQHVIVWDKSLSDLQQAGFQRLATQYGVRVEACLSEGYDGSVFYENPLIGQLVWGDLEFGKPGEGAGRKSHVSKLVTKEITKIILVSPLLNHNRAGVCGNLYSLASGSVDNFMRFESDPRRLATAVPEIYALPELGDRVVLNIVDALICQYQGEQRGLLHYSIALNELRLSTDPVALDVLSLQELDRQRQSVEIKTGFSNLDLYHNASLLEIGISNPEGIYIERLP